MNKINLIPLFAVVVSGSAIAHPGPRVWLGVEDGQLVTYRSANNIDTAPVGFVRSQVFLAGGAGGGATGDGQLRRASSDTANPSYDTWTTNWPGYQSIAGTSGFSVGDVVTYNVVSELHYFDGASFVGVSGYFGALSQPVPQLNIAVSQPNPNTGVGEPTTITVNRQTGAGAFAGDDFFHYADDSTHAHPRYTLLGDGTNLGGGADGIYALTLQLTGAGFEASDPFVLLMAKNYASTDALYQAAIEVAPSLVPEPASLGWLAVSGLLMVRRRK